jgi:FolB domain-containing protein
VEVEMDKILIKDLVARGIIGVNDWERENPQEILINITLYTDITIAGKNDDIHESVNYKTVAKKVIKHAESSNRLTVEALACDLANLCLQDPKVRKVCIRVEKPKAVRFSASVGVEIERDQRV